jgi:hypothetical protein
MKRLPEQWREYLADSKRVRSGEGWITHAFWESWTVGRDGSESDRHPVPEGLYEFRSGRRDEFCFGSGGRLRLKQLRELNASSISKAIARENPQFWNRFFRIVVRYGLSTVEEMEKALQAFGLSLGSLQSLRKRYSDLELAASYIAQAERAKVILQKWRHDRKRRSTQMKNLLCPDGVIDEVTVSGLDQPVAKIAPINPIAPQLQEVMDAYGDFLDAFKQHAIREPLQLAEKLKEPFVDCETELFIELRKAAFTPVYPFIQHVFCTYDPSGHGETEDAVRKRIQRRLKNHTNSNRTITPKNR